MKIAEKIIAKIFNQNTELLYQAFLSVYACFLVVIK